MLVAAAAGGFSQPAGSPIAVGAGPLSVAVGDLNGDGGPDLAIANNSSNSVSVLLGDGAGGFTETPSSPAAVGSEPYSVAVGDLDGDGTSDLAVANHGSNDVSVLLGDGAGGFSAPPGSPVSVGSEPYSAAVGDLDGDGRPDLAVANFSSAYVSVLLEDGAGGFSAPAGSPVSVGGNPYSVSVGDLSGDGQPDLAVANVGSERLGAAGSGRGRVRRRDELRRGVEPAVRRDRRPERRRPARPGGGERVLEQRLGAAGSGRGRVRRGAALPVAVGVVPASVAIGDLDGDGQPDLAVANYGSSDVSVLLGHGAGVFSDATGSPVAGQPAHTPSRSAI